VDPCLNVSLVKFCYDLMIKDAKKLNKFTTYAMDIFLGRVHHCNYFLIFVLIFSEVLQNVRDGCQASDYLLSILSIGAEIPQNCTRNGERFESEKEIQSHHCGMFFFLFSEFLACVLTLTGICCLQGNHCEDGSLREQQCAERKECRILS
jgi:hypothetical protein